MNSSSNADRMSSSAAAAVISSSPTTKKKKKNHKKKSCCSDLLSPTRLCILFELCGNEQLHRSWGVESLLLIYQAATGALATDHSALVILLATYCPAERLADTGALATDLSFGSGDTFGHLLSRWTLGRDCGYWTIVINSCIAVETWKVWCWCVIFQAQRLYEARYSLLSKHTALSLHGCC